MIFMETIHEDGKKTIYEGQQNMHIRSNEWYMQMFKSCNFEVHMNEYVECWGPEYFPDVLYCISPIVE